jgi:hypothetical protein
LNFGNVFSQTEKDYSDIIGLVIEEYETDTIKVYKKFQNQRLLSELDRIKSKQDREINEKYKKLEDSAKPNIYFDQKLGALYDDTVSVEVENIKVAFFPNLDWVDKKDKDRINRYYKTDFEKKRKKRPLAFISVPLISVDNKKAIVFGSYICGGLCGSGGVFFLEKVKGKWKVINYEMRWIS